MAAAICSTQLGLGGLCSYHCRFKGDTWRLGFLFSNITTTGKPNDTRHHCPSKFQEQSSPAPPPKHVSHIPTTTLELEPCILLVTAQHLSHLNIRGGFEAKATIHPLLEMMSNGLGVGRREPMCMCHILLIYNYNPSASGVAS